MKQPNILIMLHCEQETGYAIGALEKTFEAAALSSGFGADSIFWSYSKVCSPGPQTYEIGYYNSEDARKLTQLHEEYPLQTILAFDMPYPNVVAEQARRLGIPNVIAYWGASMSSLNQGLKLLAKRLEWQLRKRYAPTLFIFESEAMRLTAVEGRGVSRRSTRVIPLGVDTNRFKPLSGSKYAHRAFNIPVHRKIIFFSGHMEERKGVRVLIEAMNSLRKRNALEPFHLLICGNKGDESAPYEALIADEITRDHVTFGGYRNDIPELMQSCFIGVIASTGWDSFTMSSLEMMASGLPLVVSELQGLKETTVHGVTGFLIKPGDFEGLAQIFLHYSANPKIHHEHSRSARQRVISNFSVELQINRLAQTLNSDRFFGLKMREFPNQEVRR